MRELAERKRMVESLENLKKEMLLRDDVEYAFKINSCLYSKYPHHKEMKNALA